MAMLMSYGSYGPCYDVYQCYYYRLVPNKLVIHKGTDDCLWDTELYKVGFDQV